MKNRLPILVLLLFSIVLFTGCNDDDPEPVNEEEVITSLVFELTPQGGGSTVTLRFDDPDGDGGTPPTITTEPLAAGTIYNGVITVGGVDEDITEEIEEEDEEHQFFFQVNSAQLEVSYDDADGNGNPIGLATVVESGAVSAGSLTVILRHEPDKFGSGVSDGDITNAGGETDIEVTFSIEVE